MSEGHPQTLGRPVPSEQQVPVVDSDAAQQGAVAGDTTPETHFGIQTTDQSTADSEELQDPQLTPNQAIESPVAEQPDTVELDQSLDTIQVVAGEVIGRGGNSVAFAVQDHPDLALIEHGGNSGYSTGFSEKALAAQVGLIEKMRALPPEVNVARTLRAWGDNGKLFTLMERAKGAPVHVRNGSLEDWRGELEVLANAPVEHYRKLVEDARVLQERGFDVDPSKPDNFFYNPEEGFVFIDVGYNGVPLTVDQPLEVPIIYTSNLFNKFGNELDEQLKLQVKTILEKFEVARDKPLDYDLGYIEDAVN